MKVAQTSPTTQESSTRSARSSRTSTTRRSFGPLGARRPSTPKDDESLDDEEEDPTDQWYCSSDEDDNGPPTSRYLSGRRLTDAEHNALSQLLKSPENSQNKSAETNCCVIL